MKDQDMTEVQRERLSHVRAVYTGAFMIGMRLDGEVDATVTGNREVVIKALADGMKIDPMMKEIILAALKRM